MSRYFIEASDCSQHELFPGVVIHTAASQEMMLSLVDIAPNAVVEQHAHPHEQVGMVLKGSARFVIGDEQKVLEEGDMYRIPGGVTHQVVALDQGATALDIFHPVREEYRSLV